MALRQQHRIKRFTRAKRQYAWVGDVGFISPLDSASVGEANITSPFDITGSAAKRHAIVRKIVGTIVAAPAVIPFASAVFAYCGGIIIADVDPPTDVVDPSEASDLTEETWLYTFAGEVLCNAAVMTQPGHHMINQRPNRRITTDQVVQINCTGIPDFTDDGEFTFWWHLRILLEIP